ncbi:hypothetical protein, partial [Ruegeria lacuscaerulensis]|uniref:hypothetical protein n=1 Tax=Ruegeria lacuscaerulensis TaxID=55218 RepID=UPI001BE4D3BB
PSSPIRRACYPLPIPKSGDPGAHYVLHPASAGEFTPNEINYALPLDANQKLHSDFEIYLSTFGVLQKGKDG